MCYDEIRQTSEGVCFNAYLYNVQPGVEIDYSDGESRRINGYVPGAAIGAAAAYRELTGGGSGEAEIMKLEEQGGTDSAGEAASEGSRALPKTSEAEEETYILNTNTKKFHYPSCKSVSDMKEKNRKSFSRTREEAISRGYVPCKRCNP